MTDYEIKERDIQRQILYHLRLRRIFCFRFNTGAFSSAYGGKARFVRFGLPGGPDIFALKEGHLYAIEVKGPRGMQSRQQVVFQHEFEKAGGVYLVARSLEDVTKVLG
jgi:hypothetical protein